MIVYTYDPETKVFQNEYTPQPNPKKAGEFLLPHNSTLKKPIPKDGQAAIFNGSNWEYVPNYIGREIINITTKEKSTMQTIGEVSDGYMLWDDYILTDEYQKEQAQIQKEEYINEIKNQIFELDIKRIRAAAEPEIREDGKSWLEYYTEQIIVLREKLKELN